MIRAKTTAELFDLPPQHRGVTWDVFHAAGGRVEIERIDDADEQPFDCDAEAAAYVFAVADWATPYHPNREHRTECRRAVLEVAHSWDLEPPEEET